MIPDIFTLLRRYDEEVSDGGITFQHYVMELANNDSYFINDLFPFHDDIFEEANGKAGDEMLKKQYEKFLGDIADLGFLVKIIEQHIEEYISENDYNAFVNGFLGSQVELIGQWGKLGHHYFYRVTKDLIIDWEEEGCQTVYNLTLEQLVKHLEREQPWNWDNPDNSWMNDPYMDEQDD